MIAAANAVIADVDVVSFDVFDTLLVRRVHDPDLVKVPVARLISSLAADAGVEMTWQEVQERRDEIEQAARDDAGKEHPDHEAYYPSFMANTLQSIFGHSADESSSES